MVEPKISVAGMVGSTSGARLKTAATGKHMAAVVSASVGDVKATARLRIFPKAKKWAWDFEGYKPLQVPPTWIRAHVKLKPTKVDDTMAMKMAPGPARPSHTVMLGPADLSNYSIQADVLLREQKRKLSSVGICANRYTFILNGNDGVCQFVTWPSEWRLSGFENGAEADFVADPDIWYRMKMEVEIKEGKAHLRGKIWERGKPEPGEWTLKVVDPKPNLVGSPGIWSYALADCFFDNVVVTFR